MWTGSKIFLFCKPCNRVASQYTCCKCKRKFKKQDTYWKKLKTTILCS